MQGPRDQMDEGIGSQECGVGGGGHGVALSDLSPLGRGGGAWRDPSISPSSGRDMSVSPMIGAHGEGEARGGGPRGVVEREESVELDELLLDARDVMARVPKSDVWAFFK